MADHPAIAQARQLFAQGRNAQAKDVLQRALQKSPGDAGLNYTMGGLLTELREYPRAMYFLQRALEIDPRRGLHYSAVAECLLYQGKNDEAEPLFRKALELEPGLYSTRINLSHFAVARYDYDEAERLLREAVALRPENPEAVNNLAVVLQDTARAEEGFPLLRVFAERHPENAIVAGTLANLSNYAMGQDPAEVARRHAAYGAILSGYVRPMPPPANERKPEKRLRVAFLSPDFREHSIAYFADAAMRHLPREAFEVFGYYTGMKPDSTTQRLRSGCDQWRALADISEVKLAEMIRGDGIDLVIELSGLTQGNNLLSLALRPAPVQVTYMGYPNSTGLPAIGYRIADSVTDPAGTESRNVERLLRVEPCFLCYTPRHELLGEAKPEAAKTGGRPITFGSFNVISKMNASVVAAWAEILKRVEGSRLILKARSLSSESLRGRIAAMFSARGVAEGRVEMISYVADHAEHVRLYERVDIALDPFPYTGTTTTCEAMVMGTPVISLRGEMHAGRVGASLLGAVELPELIAGSVDEYVAKAVSLAGDRGRLAGYHATIAGRLEGSVLRDGKGFGERLGRVLRGAWVEWCTKG